MYKTNTILFIFEGNRTENQIFDNLKRYFANQNTIVECAFCSDIYQLYNKISADEDLDIFTILKNRPQNVDLLSPYKRTDFAEIYMFFDYDGHVPIANDENIKSLLKTFNEETEFGKLFISYPMVEAIKHLSPSIDFKNLKVKAKEKINYKKIVGAECDNDFQNLKGLSKDNWLEIIDCHLKKMNYNINDTYTLPTSYTPQIDIFNKQLEKYINIDANVAVLSGFPVFLFDYYGADSILNFLNEEESDSIF